MGGLSPWIRHIELYVASDTKTVQAESVGTVATLLKNDLLTVEVLVRGMDMYLTTTDSIIRSRGILFLAEVLELLSSMTLSSTSIHSLLGFFTERLADWKALRGAIVGCLALLSRKGDAGIITNHEVQEVTRSFLENLRLQSMAQVERKLSLQLIECLLDRYCDALVDMGDNLLYGFCEAIDGERDPECLLLIFRIVASLARLYPANLKDYAKELFGLIGDYFPINFTHPAEANDVKRKELSRALMLAFGSTNHFEPFAITLLLEKLSSSLPSTKVESFKYLSYCIATYAPDNMSACAEDLWSFIKNETYASPQSTPLKDFESLGRVTFQESDIMIQAFTLLQEVIRHYDGSIKLITHDNDINVFVNSLDEYKEFSAIPLQIKQRLHATGRILSTCAKTSIATCDKVFESFFPLLMGVLEISVRDCVRPVPLNFGALYLCIKLIAACRYFIVSHENCGTVTDFYDRTWFVMLSNFSGPLAEAFISLLRSNAPDKAQSLFYLGVRGLKVLATFPGRSSPLSNPTYDKILTKLLEVVASESAKTLLWTLALKALVDIGLSIDKYADTEKGESFESIVVEKIVSLLSFDDSAMPSEVKLQAAFEIGTTRKYFMMRVVNILDEAIHANFSEAYRKGNPESAKLIVNILDTYSNKVLPWFLENSSVEEISLNFALGIWDKVEDVMTLNNNPPEVASGVLDATMITMKKAVAGCSMESQDIIINKAFGVVFSEKVSLQAQISGDYSGSNEQLTSLLASVVIALRPETSIPNVKKISRLFITSVLNGHVPSAHALGSLVNKLNLDIMSPGSSDGFCLNELDMILVNFMKTSDDDDSCRISFECLRQNALKTEVEVNAIIGLAWIGKGLLMRGQAKVKDVTMALLSFLMLNGEGKEILDGINLHRLMMCAGDAFHVIMEDSEKCLNRMYHAISRPLYKQRFFSTVVPILLSLVVKAESSTVRYMLHRAFAHVISDTPLTAVLGDARKLLPMLLSCLSMLNKHVENKEIIYKVLLVISGILMDNNGENAVVENASSIVDQLIVLVTYPHIMAVRETALQCLVAVSTLPHTRIYHLKAKVLQATTRALDDPKRIVRLEAVRCRHAWAA